MNSTTKHAGSGRLGPMVSERRFPIQAQDTYNGGNVTVPWSHAEEAYKEYSAQYGTSQSLERLAQRHGFGASEIVMLLVARCKRLEAQLANAPGERPGQEARELKP